MRFAANLTKPFLWRSNLKLFLKSDGFTLIEILVSIVILSISLLALAALMATTTRNTAFGGHFTEAATFAQDQLEQLRVTSWPTINNGANNATGSSGITYDRNWNVVQNGNLKTITITIGWTERGVAHSFNFISAISQ
jgi:prepilin-type N-terminal cleavage/methylation domain-containing protein